MARLDFVFSDKRPIYIIKQKLNVLSERKLSTSDYYTTAYTKRKLEYQNEELGLISAVA